MAYWRHCQPLKSFKEIILHCTRQVSPQVTRQVISSLITEKPQSSKQKYRLTKKGMSLKKIFLKMNNKYWQKTRNLQNRMLF